MKRRIKRNSLTCTLALTTAAMIINISPVVRVSAAVMPEVTSKDVKEMEISMKAFRTPIIPKTIKNEDVKEDISEDIYSEEIEITEESELITEEPVESILLTDYISLDTPEYNHFKSFMDYRTITDRTSRQYKLQESADTDPDTGIRMVDGRYCIAVGSYYYQHMTIGTYVDIVMENGTVLPCIYAEAKSDADTDEETHRQHKSDGSVVEFVVDAPVLISYSEDVSFYGNVEKFETAEGFLFEGEIMEIRISNN